MTDKEALKLALDALNKLTDVFLDTEGSYGNYETNAIDQGYEAITALKERLADPMREVQRLGQEIEQEPVAWIHTDPDKPKVRFLEWKENEHGYRGKWIKKPIYTHPPQRTWVGLTGEDVAKAYDDYQSGRFSAGFMGAIRSIEAKLKEKNQ